MKVINYIIQSCNYMIKLINILNEMEIQEPDNIVNAFQRVIKIEGLEKHFINPSDIESEDIEEYDITYDYIMKTGYDIPSYSKEYTMNIWSNNDDSMIEINITNIPLERMNHIRSGQYKVLENFYDDEGHQLCYAIYVDY